MTSRMIHRYQDSSLRRIMRYWAANAVVVVMESRMGKSAGVGNCAGSQR